MPGRPDRARRLPLRVAEEEVDLAKDIEQLSVDAMRMMSVDAVQPPFPLGRDDQERHLVSVNFLVKKATT